MAEKQLVRTTRGNGRMIAGVASGLADYLGWGRGSVRFAFLVFALFGIGEIVYLILWVLMPKP
jgi:phage shock protein C